MNAGDRSRLMTGLITCCLPVYLSMCLNSMETVWCLGLISAWDNLVLDRQERADDWTTFAQSFESATLTRLPGRAVYAANWARTLASIHVSWEPKRPVSGPVLGTSVPDNRLTDEDIKRRRRKGSAPPVRDPRVPWPYPGPLPQRRHHPSSLRHAMPSNRRVRAPRNTRSDSSRPAEFGRNSVRVHTDD